MLSASSPLAYPSSPPVDAKRPRPHRDGPGSPAKRVAAGGFLVDDDSDSDETAGEPSPKRRMLSAAASEDRPDAAAAGVEARLAEHVDTGGSALQDGASTPPDSETNREPRPEEQDRYGRLFGLTQAGLFAQLSSAPRLSAEMVTCSGKSVPVREREAAAQTPYHDLVAARSRTKEGRARRSYYGVNIHELVSAASREPAGEKTAASGAPVAPPANADRPVRSVEDAHANLKKPQRSLLWTEKYRARTFIDLVGDDLTNRQVLRWLKRWDSTVFPHAARAKPAAGGRPARRGQPEEERPHRKVLLLAGPPGLGKTTLAHVCARQAGYEVLEINASDERSRDVVGGRIRTSLGTENVKTVEHTRPGPGRQPRVARPVCVVVDEVDGVVTGSGGSGEGGFVRALVDLILTDQRNSSGPAAASDRERRRKKRGDDFRQMRPLVLICNDVYHPSLRPLRQSGLAEIIHVGRPSMDAVVTRLKAVFEKEGIPCQKDAARKLCEAAWGVTDAIDAKKGVQSNAEGDLRGVMVVGEWVAGRLRAAPALPAPQLTRQWVEENITRDLAYGGGGARGLGRGGTKEIVTRVFQEGAGFPKQAALATAQSDRPAHREQPRAQLGFAEQLKKHAIARLSEMVETSGEVDRIMTEIFARYPEHEFNDDSYLTKPDAAYEWMHFHDACSSRIYANQEWELGPYLSQPVLACHHLFASPSRPYVFAGHERKWGDADEEDGGAARLPFSGPRADFAAFEAGRANRAALQGIQAQLPPSLARAFRSPEHIATGFLPYLVRLVSPDVKPVLISSGGGGAGDRSFPVASVRREGEKAMVRRAARVLAEVGIALRKGRIEPDASAGPAARVQWVYRMEPDIEPLATFESAGAQLVSAQAPTRYAVRQVLDQELQKATAQRESAARQARFTAGGGGGGDRAGPEAETAPPGIPALGGGVKRDFFGRVVADKPGPAGGATRGGAAGDKAWVTYHEGLNNAVRKPVSLEEFLAGL